MTVQAQDQQQHSRRGRKRFVLVGITLLLLMGVAAIWIMNVGNVVSGILSIIFTLLGITITLFQWQPHPQLEPRAPIRVIVPDELNQQRFYEQIEGMTPEVNKHKGALIIYTRKDLRGSTINLSFGFNNNNPKADLASSVIGRKRRGNWIYVAVFSLLDPGNYTIHTDSQEFVTRISILAGRVEEVDWR